uniref:Uncharacterized protein n=1 Tax=Oryza nivara TaxID=4536 RepID=A0A0E0G4G3_ORYNI
MRGEGRGRGRDRGGRARQWRQLGTQSCISLMLAPCQLGNTADLSESSHTQLRTTANRRYVTCRSPSPVRTILTAVVVVVALLLLRLHTTSATSEPPTTNVSWSVILFGARSTKGVDRGGCVPQPPLYIP